MSKASAHGRGCLCLARTNKGASGMRASPSHFTAAVEAVGARRHKAHSNKVAQAPTAQEVALANRVMPPRS